jgi:hypothetical protein
MRSLRTAALAIVASVALGAGGLSASLDAAAAGNEPVVTGAAFTTTNAAVDGTGHCKNGNEDVNCNIYDGKQYVWLNGGPSTAYVGDGSYFFAVLEPGGQADPNDATAKNLSDDYDAYTNRTFSVAGGSVTYGGSHDFAGNKIRLAPYADTSNPGGVYILAICSLDKGYPVTPSRCKYDAFKINAEAPAKALTVTKSADGSYDTSYTWSIKKDVDKTTVKQIGGNVTFNYTVTTTRSAGTNSNVKVTGTITVFNPNQDLVGGVDIDDQLSVGSTCSVTNGTDQTVLTGDNTFGYSCTLPSFPDGDVSNTVSISWPEQFLDNGSLLAEGDASFTFEKIAFTQKNKTDDCAAFSDNFNGTSNSLGTVCQSTTFTYSRTVPTPPLGYNECVSYPNTASFVTDDTGTTGSSSQTVKVCGPSKTGARNLPYWKNSMGQGLITNAGSTGGVCNVTSWLRGYAPFSDLSGTASCANVATYTKNVAKAATVAGASDAAKLRGQLIASALDVYYSDKTLGGNLLLTKKPVGGFSMDVATVCHMNLLSSGGASCSGTYVDASGVMGAGSATVTQLLATTSGAYDVGTGAFFGGDSTGQGAARDVFAALNNKAAFRG